MTLTKSEILYQGNFLRVRLDTVVDVNGKEHTREIMVSSESVVVAPIDSEGRIGLIRQHRHNHGYIWELPSGAVDQGEKPLQAAKRELQEEAGITGSNWSLISQHLNGVHEEGFNYFYMVKNLTKGESNCMEDEIITEVKFFDFDEVQQLIASNQIPDLRTRACIWAAQLKSLS